MTFTDPTHVADLLEQLLTSLATTFASEEVGRPIGRVVRFPGMAAWDCEQLVAWPNTRIAVMGTTTSSDLLRCSFRQVLDINLLLNRCITSVDTASAKPKIPAASVVDADGEAYATDMWVLQRAITVGLKDGTLLGDFSSACHAVKVNPIVPALPQGGFSGMTTKIEVTL